MKWISVKDRTPETTDLVVTLDEEGTVWCGSHSDGEWWLLDGQVGAYPDEGITHWIPMPAAPSRA